jgi:hypothetical protein
VVTSGSSSLLSEEQVENITKALPTEDECKILAAWDGTGKVSDAELFLHGLVTRLPKDLKERLTAVNLANSFRERVQRVLQAAADLQGACDVSQQGPMNAAPGYTL